MSLTIPYKPLYMWGNMLKCPIGWHLSGESEMQYLIGFPYVQDDEMPSRVKLPVRKHDELP